MVGAIYQSIALRLIASYFVEIILIVLQHVLFVRAAFGKVLSDKCDSSFAIAGCHYSRQFDTESVTLFADPIKSLHLISERTH